MRRDYFSLEVSNIDRLDDGDPEKPLVTIEFGGPAQTLRSRLTGIDDEPLSAEETDAALRLQADEDGETTGVFSLTNRVTGDFVLELNVDADEILRFIAAARRYGERVSEADGRYQLQILIDDEAVATFDKRTFLVYDEAGNLLRKDSLIPSGVEL